MKEKNRQILKILEIENHNFKQETGKSSFKTINLYIQTKKTKIKEKCKIPYYKKKAEYILIILIYS